MNKWYIENIDLQKPLGVYEETTRKKALKSCLDNTWISEDDLKGAIIIEDAPTHFHNRMESDYGINWTDSSQWENGKVDIRDIISEILTSLQMDIEDTGLSKSFLYEIGWDKKFC